jgi:FtsH-binding integral membrane protein
VPFALNFVHPLLMWVLLGLMLYSGYLGYKASLIRKVSAEERKAMVPLHYGQRHAQFGAVILGLTLLGAVGGMAATFLKNGKLILGPHLFVGLAVAVLVIATASLGPSLQKGKDWARGLHVSINGGVLLLFGWQAFTGIAIVQKLLSSAASPTSLGT